MFHKLKSKILTMVGDVMLNKYPPFFVYKPEQHKFKGDEYSTFINMIENDRLFPGDIVLRCFDGYLDTKLIPGDLNHGGIYVGRDNKGVPSVIHATAEGVHKESLYDFIRTDHFVLMRLSIINLLQRNQIVKFAYDYEGRPYDFDFTYGNDKSIYCTELVGRCYEFLKDQFKFKLSTRGFWIWKRKALVADDIFVNTDLDIVFMTKSIKKMKVWKTRQHNKK